ALATVAQSPERRMRWLFRLAALSSRRVGGGLESFSDRRSRDREQLCSGLSLHLRGFQARPDEGLSQGRRSCPRPVDPSKGSGAGNRGRSTDPAELRRQVDSMVEKLRVRPYPTIDAILHTNEIAAQEYGAAVDNPLTLWDLHWLKELDDEGFIDGLIADLSTLPAPGRV